MKTDTDKGANVEERKQKEPENLRKKEWHTVAMMKDMRRQKENNKNDTEQNKKQNKKQTNKHRKPMDPIKEMNEKLK